jgi:hypothetical protein
MGRGIERKEIFYNDTDRSDFIDRLAALVEEGAMDVYAWVLIPNHFSPFVQDSQPSLVIEYEENFNRQFGQF